MKSFEFKITNNCQLECKHCHAKSSPSSSSIPLTNTEIKTIASKYLSIIKAIGLHKNESCVVNITGGEPTIHGIDYIKRVVEIVDKELSEISSYVHYEIITNLLSFNSEFSQFIKESRAIKVCASYDPELRTLNGSYEKFAEAWSKKYMDSKHMGHEIPVVFTITRQLLNFDIWGFAERHGIQEISLQPFQVLGRGKKNAEQMWVNRKETADFIISAMTNKQGCVKTISPYDSVKEEYLKRHLTGIGSVDCWHECQQSFFVDFEGTIRTCGGCIGKYGNIFSDTPEQILGSKNRIKYAYLKTTVEAECIQCPHIYFCRNGCLLFKKVPSGGECHGLKSVIDFCVNR